MNKLLLGLLLSGVVFFTAGYGQASSPEAEKTPSVPLPAAPAAVKEEVKTQVSSPALLPEKKNEPAAEAVKVASPAAVKQSTDKKEQPKAVEAAGPAATAVADSLVLMDFNEGDFRSQRVAGFIPEKKNPDVAVNTASVATSKISFNKVSKEKLANFFVWGCVLLSFVTIIALYRHSRKKKTSEGFPPHTLKTTRRRSLYF